MKKKKSKYKSKPSYVLYIKIWYTLDSYLLTRINDYIFFEYYEWNILESILMQSIKMGINMKDIYILKKIMEYDYEVFKMILFLYWDLEYYLKGLDNVKNSLIVNSSDYIFIKIYFSNELNELKDHYEKLNKQDSSSFWADIEIYGLLNKILKYDLFFNFEPMDQNKIYIEEYNKFNDKISYDKLDLLRESLYSANKEKKIDSLYYESYIDKWYKEWFSELNENQTIKYKKKIKKLDLSLKNLMKVFKESNI